MCTNTVKDQCHSDFCRTFVPSVHPTITKEESIRQSLQSPAVTRRSAIAIYEVTTGGIQLAIAKYYTPTLYFVTGLNDSWAVAYIDI